MRTVYRKDLLLGGGATALDGIDGAILLNLDECTVYQSGVAYTYILNATSGAADDGLNTIAPDTNPGTRRWILQSTALGAFATQNPPADADLFIFRASASAWALVTATGTQIKAFLKTYFDTLYDAAGTAAGKIASSISDGDTTHAPDGNSVFDALALKQAKSGDGLAITAGKTITVEDNSIVNQDLTTDASPTFATAKLSGLTDGYIPKHTSDAVGLENSWVKTTAVNAVGVPANATTTLAIGHAGFLSVASQNPDNGSYGTYTMYAVPGWLNGVFTGYAPVLVPIATVDGISGPRTFTVTSDGSTVTFTNTSNSACYVTLSWIGGL